MTVVTGVAFVGDEKVELREFDISEPHGKQVRISIKASGICGSDFYAMREVGGARDPETGEFQIMGHEPAGVIESVGDEVSNFRVGDRVFVYHLIGCGNCYHCRRGLPVICSSPRRGSFTHGHDGGHAPLMLAPERSLVRLPDQLSYFDGAMMSCGTVTAYSGMLKTGLQAGQTLLVTGMGPVGLAAGLIASAMGATVIGTDVNAGRLQFALQRGVITHGIDSSDPAAALARILELTDGLGVHAVLEASGVSAAQELAIEATRALGTIVFVGVGTGEITFAPMDLFTLKMLTLRGSYVSSEAEAMEVAQFLAATGRHPDSLVTRVYPIEQAAEAYDDFAAGATGKLVFEF